MCKVNEYNMYVKMTRLVPGLNGRVNIETKFRLIGGAKAATAQKAKYMFWKDFNTHSEPLGWTKLHCLRVWEGRGTIMHKNLLWRHGMYPDFRAEF